MNVAVVKGNCYYRRQIRWTKKVNMEDQEATDGGTSVCRGGCKVQWVVAIQIKALAEPKSRVMVAETALEEVKTVAPA